ncbi:MAG: SIP domain-containing protein [Actinomycetota bacterium]
MTDVAITGFDAEPAADIRYALEHLEGNHADSIVFIAANGPNPVAGITDATISAVDPDGMTLGVTAAGGTTDHRLPFAEPVADMEQLRGQLMGFLAAARAAAPEAEPTSIEREIAATSSLETRVVEVTEVTDVTSTIVEVTLGGLDGLPALGGDEFFYLMIPSATGPNVLTSGVTMTELFALPEDQRPHGAYYTSRRRRPEVDEIDLWIVRHGEVGVSGWAGQATPGDRVAIWGPRRAYEPPSGTSSHLLVVDETGLAAAAAIVDGLPADHPATVIAETGDEAPPPFPTRPGIEYRWRSRNGAAPGTTGTLLAAVEASDVDVDGCYAFGAAESRAISAVRRHLRHDRGMGADQVHMTGYWRRSA